MPKRKKRKRNERFHWHGSRWSPYGAADMSWRAPSKLREVYRWASPEQPRAMCGVRLSHLSEEARGKAHVVVASG